jgi:hypothetical protein
MAPYWAGRPMTPGGQLVLPYIITLLMARKAG